ncbi:uncharacterized protein LY89DRAFT_760834 [Mollisia scopiformis]|uniref:Uncharacterized protein n=1 Tax=Mollisia scopiformis TaxID=149040 RepID=A0A132BDF8_MOLSC|nr:uncharacterized protein LY89DRAFT_760834 [Mollisia scopiformis]KUJ10019.1 hypothetical protein LY89DRAFT_760834 [Mollisia scopiformis]
MCTGPNHECRRCGNFEGPDSVEFESRCDNPWAYGHTITVVSAVIVTSACGACKRLARDEADELDEMLRQQNSPTRQLHEQNPQAPQNQEFPLFFILWCELNSNGELAENELSAEEALNADIASFLGYLRDAHFDPAHVHLAHLYGGHIEWLRLDKRTNFDFEPLMQPALPRFQIWARSQATRDHVQQDNHTIAASDAHRRFQRMVVTYAEMLDPRDRAEFQASRERQAVNGRREQNYEERQDHEYNVLPWRAWIPILTPDVPAPAEQEDEPIESFSHWVSRRDYLPPHVQRYPTHPGAVAWHESIILMHGAADRHFNFVPNFYVARPEILSFMQFRARDAPAGSVYALPFDEALREYERYLSHELPGPRMNQRWLDAVDEWMFQARAQL